MKILKNNWFMLKWIYQYTPGFFFATIAEGLVWGCIHSFTSVLFIKMLFDRIESAAPFEQIVSVIGGMAVFLVLAYIFHEWYWKFLEPKAEQELHSQMQQTLFKKAIAMDLTCYDNPEFYNDFVWAVREADRRAIAVAKEFGKVINRGFSSLVIISVLFTVDPIIVGVICVAVGISVAIRLWQTKLQFHKEEEIRPIQRKTNYVNRTFYLADYAKELRMSNAGELLHRHYDHAVENIVNIHQKFAPKLFIAGLLRSVAVSTLFDVGILLLLVYKISVQKTITLGDFAASLSATWKLFRQIQDLMARLAKFKEHSLYTEKFRAFLEYQITVQDSSSAKALEAPLNEISFQNVSFAYPEASHPTLKNLTFVIPKYRKIAIVGPNGAGKTTLIKLITRMYNPTEGEIRINGVPVSEHTIHSVREKIGITFQDYKIYATSVAENILMDLFSKEDEPALQHSLAISGFSEKVASLPDGLKTELTREFHPKGTVLSGGEQQRIAVSRAFARDYDLIILDEPSAALDPVIEYELNRKLDETITNKTVILISHRLSTVCMADEIFMMENGQIVERGTHGELIRLNGKYAEMFRIQAEKYHQEENYETKNI